MALSVKDFFVKVLLLFIPSKKLRAHIMFKTRYKVIDVTKLTELEFYRYCREEYNIGEYSYIAYDTVIKNKKHSKIGKFCSIARGTHIGTSQHPINLLSTHGIAYSPIPTARAGGNLVAAEKNVVKLGE